MLFATFVVKIYEKKGKRFVSGVESQPFCDKYEERT